MSEASVDTPVNIFPDNVVVIGGGTGTSSVVSGFAPRVQNLNAIVTTFDDGGGAGDLRNVYDMMAVGDIRQTSIAMSPLSSRVKRLLGHRFSEGINGESKFDVAGQVLGNLAIAGAIQQENGDLDAAMAVIKELFGMQGEVMAASQDNRRLGFELANGLMIEGEHKAEEEATASFRGAKISFDKGAADLSASAAEAIATADMVVIAPGDLYTSIGPTLVLRGMGEALQSAKSVMMVSNLMNPARHTHGFTTADYVHEYTRLAGGQKFIDRVVFNTRELNPAALEEQIVNGSHPVVTDVECLELSGYAAHGYDLLSEGRVEFDKSDRLAVQGLRSEIRHDPNKVFAALLHVYMAASTQ